MTADMECHCRMLAASGQHLPCSAAQLGEAHPQTFIHAGHDEPYGTLDSDCQAQLHCHKMYLQDTGTPWLGQGCRRYNHVRDEHAYNPVPCTGLKPQMMSCTTCGSITEETSRSS